VIRALTQTSLLHRSAPRGANVVLSPHTGFELAKTFAHASERAKKLFLYVREFVLANVPCTKEISGILEAEMLALRSPTLEMRPFFPPENYREFRRDVEDLADGNFDDRANEYVRVRSSLGLTARLGPARHLRSDVAQRLRSVAPADFERWMETEIRSARGIMLLTEQITRQFPEAPVEEAMSWASPLLASPVCRLARGLVCADLYFNWRWAHRGSVPKDLYPDMYHVLISTYCDVYATKESKQAEYAGLLLTPGTKVSVYDGRDLLHGWLEALVRS
jgi:hypothetical protein